MTDKAAFVVEDVIVIDGRGPVITRSLAAARQATGRFALGDRIECGHRTARVVGIEGFAIVDPPQQGLLLDGVAVEDLAVGQIWLSGLPPRPGRTAG